MENNELLNHDVNYDNKNEFDDSEEIVNNELLGYDIAVFYNTYNLSVLLKWIEEKKLIVPKFQRSYTWDRKQASAFIDSLLRGLPIPSFFIYDDRENNKYLIIDGQQRLISLYKYIIEKKFKDGEKEFRLVGESIHNNWKELTFEELEDYKDKLEDTLLNVTTIRSIGNEKDQTPLYIIFQRLNTGGTPLRAQEIRMAINYGELAKYIDDIASDSALKKWEFLRTSEEKNNDNTTRIQEFLLKIFAYYFEYNENKLSGSSMRSFLDNFFHNQKDFDSGNGIGVKKYSKTQFETVFFMIKDIANNLDEKYFIPFGNKPIGSFAIAILIGIIDYYIKSQLGGKIDYNKIKDSISKWKSCTLKEEFEEIFQPRRTSLESVRKQIEKSVQYFAEALNEKN